MSMWYGDTCPNMVAGWGVGGFPDGLEGGGQMYLLACGRFAFNLKAFLCSMISRRL